MHKLMAAKNLVLALLLTVLVAGCGDPDKNASAGPGSPTSPPTVTAVTPPAGSTLVCPNTPVVTATFSKAMNPATINTSTFKLNTGGSNVSGQVTFVAATNIAS